MRAFDRITKIVNLILKIMVNFEIILYYYHKRQSSRDFYFERFILPVTTELVRPIMYLN